MTVVYGDGAAQRLVKKLDAELSSDSPAPDAFRAWLDAEKLRAFGFAELAQLVTDHPVRIELGSVKLVCDDDARVAQLVLGDERFAEFLEREVLFEEHGVRAYGLRFQASNAPMSGTWCHTATASSLGWCVATRWTIPRSVAVLAARSHMR
jgi:hypothetical protein